MGTSVNNVTLYKPERGQSAGVVYSSSSFEYHSLKNLLKFFFLHADTGCETTSAIFGQGKIKSYTTVQNNIHLKDLVLVFTKQKLSFGNIAFAEKKYIISLCGGNINIKNLDDFRYQQFRKSAATRT